MPLVRTPKPHRHPRSLDALFPPPKIKRCPHGHSQTPEWRPIWGCSTCRKQEAEFAARQLERTAERQGASRAERERWRAILPPLPDPYVLRCTDGSRPQVFRAGGRRRPGSRRRVKRRA